MEKLPASNGWLWVKQGFQLFRKQPGGLTTLILLYGILNMVVGIIPLLGQVLLIVLIPVFSTAFMQACANIEQEQRVTPALLITGFRSPALPQLIALGMLYMVAGMLAIGVASLADDGTLLKLLTGQLDPRSPQARDANLGGAFGLAILVCIPAAMAFCFGAPLIYWKQMSIGKAVFFSFYAVLRSAKAFIVFALSLFGITMVGSQLVILIFGRSDLAMNMLVALSMLLSVLMHCAFYASYKQIFGAPYEAPQKEAPKPEA